MLRYTFVSAFTSALTQGARAAASAGARAVDTARSVFGPPPSPVLAGFEGAHDGEDADSAVSLSDVVGRLARRGQSGLEALSDAIWLAVPKRKTSYSKKRHRQMNPRYAPQNALNFYPCPKCDTPGGPFLKLRHHLCPCDQEKLNCVGVRKVRARRRRAE
jgi:ribosomal protein L32